MKQLLLPLSIIYLVILFACNSDYTVGKKRGYFKINFPEKAYRIFDQRGYPYTFEYPAYANIVKDTTFFIANLKIRGGLTLTSHIFCKGSCKL